MPKNVQITTQLRSFHMLTGLKILQARLQQYVNQERLDIQAGFRKGRETRDQITDIHWHDLLDHRKSKRIPEKHLLLLH